MPALAKRIPLLILPYESGLRFLLLAIISSVVFILAGGVYILSEYPSLVEPLPEYIFRRSTNEQFMFESLVSAFLILLGAGGFLRINVASKYAYDSLKSTTNLIIGMLMVISASYAIHILFDFRAYFMV